MVSYYEIKKKHQMKVGFNRRNQSLIPSCDSVHNFHLTAMQISLLDDCVNVRHQPAPPKIVM